MSDGQQQQLFARRSKTGLLPCPFCGQIDLSVIELKPQSREIAFVQCESCGCTGPSEPSISRARALWDMRSKEV